MDFINQTNLLTVIMAMFGTLCSASIINFGYGQTNHAQSHPDLYVNIKQRICSWWGMSILFLATCLLGKLAVIGLFTAVSFLALRELITQMQTRRADHGSLSWAFFVILPLQYIFLAMGRVDWFAIFVPVFGLMNLVVRNIIAKEPKGFVEKTAEVYLAVIICVYAIGHVPALALLGDSQTGIGLLVFFVITVQACDVLQFVSGKLLGRRQLSPVISPNKTIEGALGGIVLTAIIGAGLSFLVPAFSWWQGALLAGLIGACGLFGDLFMSAIKRDLGIKDFSQMIPGHGGILDRVDSMVIAGPVFYYAMKLIII